MTGVGAAVGDTIPGALPPYLVGSLAVRLQDDPAFPVPPVTGAGATAGDTAPTALPPYLVGSPAVRLQDDPGVDRIHLGRRVSAAFPVPPVTGARLGPSVATALTGPRVLAGCPSATGGVLVLVSCLLANRGKEGPKAAA